MRAVTTCVIALVLAGCSTADNDAADTTAGATGAVEAAPATLSLADLAGTWNVSSRIEGNDTTLVDYQLVATADRSGWSIKFPDREPIPVRVVAVEGDSVVYEAGPFESVLRKGVQVRTHVVGRLRDGRLVGNTVARYDVTGADTVTRLSYEATRAP
jgi:hypothetical protein